jgi:hypothetical protein
MKGAYTITYHVHVCVNAKVDKLIVGGIGAISAARCITGSKSLVIVYVGGDARSFCMYM